MKIKKTCSECGTEDILFDAWAQWNSGRQEYFLVDVYPKAICSNCGGECGVNETQIEEDGT
jgi:hypothetical protein